MDQEQKPKHKQANEDGTYHRGKSHADFSPEDWRESLGGRGGRFDIRRILQDAPPSVERAFRARASRLDMEFDAYLDKLESGVKHCGSCGKWRSRERFYDSAVAWDGKDSTCKDCRRRLSREGARRRRNGAALYDQGKSPAPRKYQKREAINRGYFRWLMGELRSFPWEQQRSALRVLLSGASYEQRAEIASLIVDMQSGDPIMRSLVNAEIARLKEGD